MEERRTVDLGPPRSPQSTDTRLNRLGNRSEWNVAVLAPRILKLFIAQHGQRTADSLSCFVGHDDIVDKATRTGHERIGKLGLVLDFTLGKF